MRARWSGSGSTSGRRPPRSGSGQALTEFALVLPFLAVLFMGVLDLGRAFHTEVAASNAARVGLIYAQEVASPRMLDCNTTCQFITVGAIINTVKQEAQGGIDTSQAQVTVCLQHVTACPVTNMSEAVASDEAITISVIVPFQNITPFVHLSAIAGTVTGKTFPFEPVYPTNTPGPSPTATATPTGLATATSTATPTPTSTSTSAPAATATSTGTSTSTPTPTSTLPPGANTPTPGPTNTATATATFTPTPGPTSTPTSTTTPTSTPTEAIPNIMTPGPSAATPMPPAMTTPLPHTVAIRWSTDQPYALNYVWVAPATNTGSANNCTSNGNGASADCPTGPFHRYTATSGTNAFIQFSSVNGQGTYLSPNTHYVYYVESDRDQPSGASYWPASCATSCDTPMYLSEFTI